MQRLIVTSVILVGALVGIGCASGNHYIAGTKEIPDTPENWKIIRVVEDYRIAMERKDAPALVAMASKSYWNTGEKPQDDYGYDGLRDVLATRFQRADQIRYSVHYMRIRRDQNRAYVDVLIDASYSISTAKGPERHDKKDQNELVLQNDEGRWMFVSGM